MASRRRNVLVWIQSGAGNPKQENIKEKGPSILNRSKISANFDYRTKMIPDNPKENNTVETISNNSNQNQSNNYIQKEIHGIDTFMSEILEEMRDDEIDAIMKGIRQMNHRLWEGKGIIHDVNFYNNVINKTVGITRTIRIKL
jgi:hypothetical protein